MNKNPKLSSKSIAWISGGPSHIGTERPEIKSDGEGPPRKTLLKPFGLSKTVTTFEEFSLFTQDTGYVTDAERLGWSFVFRGLLEANGGPQLPDLPWWNAVPDACWSAPLGKGSGWAEMPYHPVVQVSLNDARAYADWVGGRLPTEAEWEHAARGGAQTARYPWGDEEPDDHNANLCNIWQGNFPNTNTCADGHYGTAPAHSFPPNAFDLYHMAGNVWEWCSDAFRIRSLSKAAKTRNVQARRDREHVLKGGSFLCHASYCWRYRIAARSGRPADNGTSNCGFRIAFDVDSSRTFLP